MNKVFENIIEKLEEDEKHTFDGCINKRYAIEIVKQEAEQYNNGWIPCSGCADCEHKECENYGKV